MWPFYLKRKSSEISPYYLSVASEFYEAIITTVYSLHTMYVIKHAPNLLPTYCNFLMSCIISSAHYQMCCIGQLANLINNENFEKLINFSLDDRQS